MGLLKSFLISFAALATLSAATAPTPLAEQMVPAHIESQIAALVESNNMTDAQWIRFSELDTATHEHQKRGHHHHRKPVLVGDGSPIQRHLWTQVSFHTPCDHCHIESAKTTVDSFVLTNQAPEWTSGGFEVEREFNRALRHGYCKGGPGKWCMWWSIAFTEYTVRHADGGEPYKIRSPNTGNAGGLGPFCMSAEKNWCPGFGTYFWDSAPSETRPGAQP